jgi:hypothetical protein
VERELEDWRRVWRGLVGEFAVQNINKITNNPNKKISDKTFKSKFKYLPTIQP